MSDWFSREDAQPLAVVVKKPNPKNVQNQEKIRELEEKIQRYVSWAWECASDQTDYCGKITKGTRVIEVAASATINPTD